MTPTLVTQRLSLEPLTRATLRQVRWLTTPEVVRYSEQRHKVHSLDTQERYINKFKGHLWNIVEVGADNHIGNLSASVDIYNHVADVGILIGETDCWGKGFGKEAWLVACNWLLAAEGRALHKLEAGCMANNTAMVRILNGSGFAFEGERHNHFLFGGNPIGMKLFGRFR